MKRRLIVLPVLALVLAAGCGSERQATEAELTPANFASTLAEAQERVHTAHIDAVFTAMGERFTVTGDVQGDRRDLGFDLAMSGAAMGDEARVILDDDVLYLRVPGLTPGQRYFSLDIDRSNHPAARMLGRLLDQMRQLDPSQAMKAFEATVDLEKVGAAEVDGVATTRYDVTVDTREALRAMNMDGFVPPQRLPGTMRYDVWVDHDHLVRRLRATVFGADMDMRFSQWGEPVDITAPPARLTTPMPGMAHLRGSATARGRPPPGPGGAVPGRVRWQRHLLPIRGSLVKLKRLGVLAASFALALTAGCGGSGGSEDSAALTKANFGRSVTQALTKAQTAHMEGAVSAAGQNITMSGDMQMARKDVAFDLSMRGAALGGGGRIIVLDDIIYLKLSAIARTDKFIKVDVSDPSDPMAQMFSQMMGQLDPSKTFDVFDQVTRLQQRGTQEIDGVETTHYVVTVDTKAVLQAQGMGTQMTPGQMPKTIQYDVWVDADNLVRKLSMDLQGNTVDMTLSRWGEPVEISAPPPSQVTDVGQLMGQTSG